MEITWYYYFLINNSTALTKKSRADNSKLYNSLVLLFKKYEFLLVIGVISNMSVFEDHELDYKMLILSNKLKADELVTVSIVL